MQVPPPIATPDDLAERLLARPVVERLGELRRREKIRHVDDARMRRAVAVLADVHLR